MLLSVNNNLSRTLCLADLYESLPFTKFDLRNYSLNAFFRSHKFDNSPFKERATPDYVAMRFYVWELYMQELERVRGRYYMSLSPTWTEGLKNHKEFLIKEGFRSLHYLLAICIRESRHVKLSEVNATDILDASHRVALNTDKDTLSKLFRVLDADGFFGSGHDKVTRYIQATFPSNYTIQNVLDFLKLVFKQGSFETSYGGEAWYDLTCAAEQIVQGHESLYSGLDHTFSLCHNTGAIYNKGFFYKNHRDTQYGFSFLLDCQRSGQLINAVCSGYLHYAMTQGAMGDLATAQMAPKAIDLTGRKDGLYPILQEILKLNPEHARPLSFVKLRDDGAVNNYAKEISAETGAEPAITAVAEGGALSGKTLSLSKGSDVSLVAGLKNLPVISRGETV